MLFNPIDADGLDTLRAWFADGELSRRIDYPSPEWFRHVTEVPGNRAWLIHEDDQPVGQVQLDTQPDRTGGLSLIVRPDLRGRGMGKCILQALCRRPEVQELERLEAWVEADNAASLNCFLASGFSAQREAPDENGLLVLVRERPGGCI